MCKNLLLSIDKEVSEKTCQKAGVENHWGECGSPREPTTTIHCQVTSATRTTMNKLCTPHTDCHEYMYMCTRPPHVQSFKLHSNWKHQVPLQFKHPNFFLVPPSGAGIILRGHQYYTGQNRWNIKYMYTSHRLMYLPYTCNHSPTSIIPLSYLNLSII